jgi:hypothetical protein
MIISYDLFEKLEDVAATAGNAGNQNMPAAHKLSIAGTDLFRRFRF